MGAHEGGGESDQCLYDLIRADLHADDGVDEEEHGNEQTHVGKCLQEARGEVISYKRVDGISMR